MNKRIIEKPRLLDLFCGCGGMSLGFQMAGYEVVAGIDNWKDSLQTFAKNHHDSIPMELDLSALNPSEIHKKIGKKVDIIVGGPPCQGFSIAGKRNPNDTRNQLYMGFLKFVDYFRPKIFVMENVPNIVSMSEGAILKKILEDFQRIGYVVTYKILMASDYGVPQNRRRVFIVGSQDGKPFDFSLSLVRKKITVKEAISDLPDESLTEGSKYLTPPMSEYQKQMRKNSTGIFNHVLTQHNPKTIEIIAMVPDGGNYKNLPKSLWDTRKVNIAWTRFKSWEPCSTIDTGHNHHFHYEYHRVPTVRESARIQSFPDTFLFEGNKTSQLKQVGNAVPPLLANSIAVRIKELYEL